MHEGDKILNQGMLAHVGIIDGTLLEEAVWVSLFPFICTTFQSMDPVRWGVMWFFGRTLVLFTCSISVLLKVDSGNLALLSQ